MVTGSQQQIRRRGVKLNIELRKCNITRNVVKQLTDATMEEMLAFEIMGWIALPVMKETIRTVIYYNTENREIRKSIMPRAAIPVKSKISEDWFLKVTFEDGFSHIYPKNFTAEQTKKVQQIKTTAEERGQIFTSW
jgi:hypothetical protein